MEDTLKDIWATRPRRPRQGRKVAGVAAAIGNRYGIDPVIVRVGFVVATVYGGAGILLYLLGWMLLAEEDDEVSPLEALHGRGRSSTSTMFTLALGAAMFPAFWWFFDHDFSGVLGVVLVVAALFLLHRNRSHLGSPGRAPAADTALADEPAAPTVVWDPIQPTVRDQQPPAWDPLGAAPFAWDLPEPSAPEPEPTPPARRRRSKVTGVTIALTFLIIGGAVIAQPHAAGWLTVPHVIGVVLGILGLGMVAGSFSRGGRGLIGFAAPLAVIGVAMTAVWPNGFTADGVGDIRETPTSVEQVNDRYVRNIGSVHLDLTKLPASTGEVETEAKVDVGDVTVVVPKNADVTVKCSVGVGDMTCLGEESDAPGGDDLELTDYGPDGPGGLKIELEAEVSGPGTVEVRRG